MGACVQKAAKAYWDFAQGSFTRCTLHKHKLCIAGCLGCVLHREPRRVTTKHAQPTTNGNAAHSFHFDLCRAQRLGFFRHFVSITHQNSDLSVLLCSFSHVHRHSRRLYLTKGGGPYAHIWRIWAQDTTHKSAFTLLLALIINTSPQSSPLVG